MTYFGLQLLKTIHWTIQMYAGDFIHEFGFVWVSFHHPIYFADECPVCQGLQKDDFWETFSFIFAMLAREFWFWFWSHLMIWYRDSYCWVQIARTVTSAKFVIIVIRWRRPSGLKSVTKAVWGSNSGSPGRLSGRQQASCYLDRYHTRSTQSLCVSLSTLGFRVIVAGPSPPYG